MAAQYKTPGVYVKEENAFPNSVVQVATAIPAFIGYTELARRGTDKLDNKPTRIASLAEYESMFGRPALTKVKLTEDASAVAGVVRSTQFNLYPSLRLYFMNGGGPCYIVSVGNYDTAIASGKSAKAIQEASLAALRKEYESTMVLMPDAVLLDDPADCHTLAQQVLDHCHNMQSRIGIFDVYNGDQERTHDEQDVISGTSGFRSIVSDFFNYGVAYYPWLHTNLLEEADVDFGRLTEESRTALAARLTGLTANDPKLSKLADTIGVLTAALTDAPEDAKKRTNAHNTLMAVLPEYKKLMTAVRRALNVVPPSGAMAGVYARTDAAIGVQKAPANTGITGAIEPCVDISQEDQEDLNVPLNGMAVNAIRVLPGRGMRVWGARTLDGNSQDWRYINVRRSLIMLEQSIKAAAQAYVFEPNNALTWSNVRNMISNFLTNQWKAGVLMGSKPEDAFQVEVGLGSTMTGDDVLDGYMNVVVKVCLVRPAEFIVITFRQLMPTS